MKGLEISVANNDLVIKQEERLVKLFVMFKDIKYGTKYVIFTDNDGKKLYYGSPLINANKMVIMKFKDIKDAEMVKEFVWNYLNDKSVSGFEIIEVPKIEKLEIIDNNELDVKEEYIKILNDIFFKKEEVVIENNDNIKVKEKNNKGPILFMVIVFIAFIAGFLYLSNNSELIFGKEIFVECRKNYNISELDATSNEVITLTFNNSQVLKKHDKNIIFKFNNNDKYFEFKEKNWSYKYLNESGTEKYLDDELSYSLFIDYDLNKNYILPKGYDELYDYYKDNGYSCSNIEK